MNDFNITHEANELYIFRLWEAAGSHWLVRVKDNPKVDYEGKAMACKAVAQELAFIKTRPVSYHGKTVWQWVAETEVTLTRPAKPSQKKSKKPAVPGILVAARRVVSRILSEAGEVLAEWLLLTNVAEVEAATIALGYYGRWQIEIYQTYCLHKSIYKKLMHFITGLIYPDTLSHALFT